MAMEIFVNGRVGEVEQKKERKEGKTK